MQAPRAHRMLAALRGLTSSACSRGASGGGGGGGSGGTWATGQRVLVGRGQSGVLRAAVGTRAAPSATGPRRGAQQQLKSGSTATRTGAMPPAADSAVGASGVPRLLTYASRTAAMWLCTVTLGVLSTADRVSYGPQRRCSLLGGRAGGNAWRAERAGRIALLGGVRRSCRDAAAPSGTACPTRAAAPPTHITTSAAAGTDAT